MKVTGGVNNNALNKINDAVIESLILTGDAVRDNLAQSQTMPFDTGNLANDATYVDDSKANSGKVVIISDTPYARRLYFHPEYNFNKEHNPNAGGLWFEPYLEGIKKDYAKKVFASFLADRL